MQKGETNMLEHFYKSSRYLQHLQQPPFAESINALAGRFYQLGYPKRYSQRVLWVVGKFNDYARTIGIGRAEEVHKSLVQRFVDEGLIHQRILGATAVKHLLNYFQDQGIVPTTAV
jgi:hypothetical protein